MLCIILNAPFLQLLIRNLPKFNSVCPKKLCKILLLIYFERLVVSVVGSYLEIDVLQGLNTFNTVYAEAVAQKYSVKKVLQKTKLDCAKGLQFII